MKKCANPAQIPKRCEYCQNNLGENIQIGHMWHCSHLSYCVVFGLNYCKAQKLFKGKFVLDENKYMKWKKKKSSSQ